MRGDRLCNVRRQILLHDSEDFRGRFALGQMPFLSAFADCAHDLLSGQIHHLEITAPPHVRKLRIAYVDWPHPDHSANQQFRIGRRLAAGITATIVIVWSAVPLWVTFLTWGFAGCGIGLVFTTVSTTGMNLAAAGTEGLVSSQLGIADALGFALATGFGGALIGLADHTRLELGAALALVFAASALVAVVGAAIASRVRAPAVVPV